MPTSYCVSMLVDLLTPYVTTIVNASLSQGRLPESQKHAIVLPLLKTSGMNSAVVANFRPVSNLSFLSKLIERERVVTRQLHVYLLPRYQSTYRRQNAIIRPRRPDCACSRTLWQLLTIVRWLMCGPFNFAATVAAEFWSKWYCLAMVDIVLEWSDTADWSTTVGGCLQSSRYGMAFCMGLL